MPLHKVRVALTIRGPFLTRSTGQGRHGLDASAARTSDGRNWLLPWTLVKGKVREAWNELGLQAEAATWLGEATGRQGDAGNGSLEPDRGKIHCEGEGFIGPLAGQAGERSRILIDDERGSVAYGALQVIEEPLRSGETAAFHAELFFDGSVEDTEKAAKTVAVGLRWAGQVGSLRTIGFGRLTDVQIGPPEPMGSTTTPSVPPSDVLALSIEPLAPFCFAGRNTGGNLFETADLIPGAAVKGAIARDLTRAPTLKAYLHQVRISHAFPALDSGERPVRMPKSVVRADGGDFCDVIDCKGPRLIDDRAPRFDVDWKRSDEDEVRKHYDWPAVTRELRVRTAIDSDKRRAATEELFGVEAVVPSGRKWLASVDFFAIEDESTRSQAAEELLALLHEPLGPLGKTKAFANVGPERCETASVARRGDGRWALTLQTDAILADPARLTNDESLFDAYRAVWTDLSQGALRLVRFFSVESLAGGFYLFRRFQQSHQKDYQPWLLTEAGSVFLLEPTEGAEDRASKLIDTWARTGLPLPEWAVNRYGVPETDAWKWCPYLPENGYGEVAVNLDRAGVTRIAEAASDDE